MAKHTRDCQDWFGVIRKKANRLFLGYVGNSYESTVWSWLRILASSSTISHGPILPALPHLPFRRRLQENYNKSFTSLWPGNSIDSMLHFPTTAQWQTTPTPVPTIEPGERRTLLWGLKPLGISNNNILVRMQSLTLPWTGKLSFTAPLKVLCQTDHTAGKPYPWLRTPRG